MTATLERNPVAEAREALAEVEAAHAALTARLATDRALTPADLRASLDRVEFAQRRLAQAEQDALDGSRSARRHRLRQLAERAAKQAEGLGKLERLAQRRAMARDEEDAAICDWNRGSHALSEELRAFEAEAAAAGDDPHAIAAELGLTFEAFSARLQGGMRVGDIQLPKFAIPVVSGGFDRSLVQSPVPAPPPPPPGPSCVVTDESGRRWSWKDHLVTPVDAGDMNVARRGGYRCERCGTWWSRAAWEAHWRPANAAAD